jgi:glycosyltransferase involved in cell wall biosynthesis
MNHNNKISVVVPVYNNALSLETLIIRLQAILKTITSDYELIFINDGSVDNSYDLLKKIALDHSQVKLINFSRNFGQHPAISAGFERATGDITVLMDADLQDRPEDIPLMLNKLYEDDSDIVYSVRNKEGKKYGNKISSALFHYCFSKIVKSNVPVNIGTFRLFNRKFLQSLTQFKEYNILYGPLMFYMGFKSSFVELSFEERAHGKSQYTFRKRLALALNSLISYTDIPHKMTIIIGATLLVISTVYSIIVTLQYALIGSSLPVGATLILLVLCITLGSIMITLGVIGSYIFRVYQEVLRRPRYLISETINIS